MRKETYFLAPNITENIAALRLQHLLSGRSDSTAMDCLPLPLEFILKSNATVFTRNQSKTLSTTLPALIVTSPMDKWIF